MLTADARTGGTDLAGGTLELRIVTFADSTFALPTTVTLLPVLGEAGGFLQGALAGAPRVVGVADALPALAASVSCEKHQPRLTQNETLAERHSVWKTSTFHTSTELVVRPVTVEVVALAEHATVDLSWIVPLLALTGAADAVSVVAADICTVVFSAVGIQVFRAHLVFAALTDASDTSVVTPGTEQVGGLAKCYRDAHQNEGKS